MMCVVVMALRNCSPWVLSVSWQFPPSMAESSSSRARHVLMVSSLLSAIYWMWGQSNYNIPKVNGNTGLWLSVPTPFIGSVLGGQLLAPSFFLHHISAERD